MERSEVKELLKTIDIYYPNQGSPDPKLKLDAWELILKKHDKEKVMSNFYEHVESNIYPPKIAELIKKPQEDARTVPNVKETYDYLTKVQEPAETTAEEVDHYLAKIREILGIKAGESNE